MICVFRGCGRRRRGRPTPQGAAHSGDGHRGHSRLVAAPAGTGRRRAIGRRQPKVPAGAAGWNGWPRVASSTPSELVEDCPARGTGLVMPPVSIAATSPNLAPRLGPKTWPQEMNGNFIRRCRKSQVQSFTPKAEAAHAALGQDHIEPRLDHAGQIHPAPAPHAINGTVWSFVNQLCSCCGVSRGFGPAARARPDQMESFDR
jgi:hypothetical protein